jgi:hypothetical protein
MRLLPRISASPFAASATGLIFRNELNPPLRVLQL